MKVYIVTQGCWEDFGIVKLFATEEQAKAFCDEYNFGEVNEDSYDYQEYDVSEEMTERQDKKMYVAGYIVDDELEDYWVSDEYLENREDQFEEVSDDVGKFVEFSFALTATKDETYEQFEKRAKQVAIDKYSEWKVGKVND